MANRVLLEINNLNYSGWNKVTFSDTMESVTSAFSIVLISGKEIQKVKKGDVCRLYIQDDSKRELQLLQGYIDEITRSRSGTKTALAISGRGTTQDLVDCSAIFPPSNTWRKKTLAEIAKDICDPLNITVQDETIKGESFDKITIQSGETGFTLIERLCRQRGVLPLTNTSGDLVLTYATESTADVVEDLIDGENILELSEKDSLVEQFSEYTVKGQSGGGGLAWQEKTTTSFKGTAIDKSVTRFRPMVIMAESKSTPTSVKLRAAWEAQVRAGRAKVHTVVVLDWMQKPGTNTDLPEPWKPNTLVNLISVPFDIEEKRLITSVSYSLDTKAGRTTTLTLKHPDTYKANPSGEVDL